MLAVPAATPVTTPVLLTVALVIVLLDHVPPVVASANVIASVPPAHILVPPVIGSNVCTVTVTDAEQPVRRRRPKRRRFVV